MLEECGIEFEEAERPPGAEYGMEVDNERPPNSLEMDAMDWWRINLGDTGGLMGGARLPTGIFTPPRGPSISKSSSSPSTFETLIVDPSTEGDSSEGDIPSMDTVVVMTWSPFLEFSPVLLLILIVKLEGLLADFCELINLDNDDIGLGSLLSPPFSRCSKLFVLNSGSMLAGISNSS